MYAAYDMHFRNGLPVITLYDVEHFLLGELPSFIAMLVLARIGAEVAGKDADIGRFDVEIPVEIDFIAVQAPGYMGSQRTDERKVTYFKKQNALLFGKALALLHFFGNAKKAAISIGIA
jgi:hypothetical protein